MSTNVTEIFDLLSDRYELLQLLATESYSQQQLVKKTELSQSTVSRALTRLQDLGIVSESDGQYEITLLGVLVHDKYESHVAEFEQLYAAKDILHELPAEAPIDPALLAGAEVTTSKPHAPDAPLAPILRLTREATAIKCAANVLHAGYRETFENRMCESELETEFVITEAVAEQAGAIDDGYDRAPREDGRVDMYKTDTLPYSLFLVETTAGTYTGLVVSADGGTQGTLINGSDEAYQWAQDQYEQFKSEATRWDPYTDV
jgi:predicted transcriptional regulator